MGWEEWADSQHAHAGQRYLRDGFAPFIVPLYIKDDFERLPDGTPRREFFAPPLSPSASTCRESVPQPSRSVTSLS